MNILSVLLGFWGSLSLLFGIYLANLNGTMFEAKPFISLLILGFFGMITLMIGYALGAHLLKVQVSEKGDAEEE